MAGSGAQQLGPVIGFLHSQTSNGFGTSARISAGTKGKRLRRRGNLAIEYGWAQNQAGRLRSLTADLVSRRVAVLAAMDTPSALAAKEAMAPLAVVFMTGIDPVAAGLVASLARPGGNLTGVNFLSGELTAKRLESCVS